MTIRWRSSDRSEFRFLFRPHWYGSRKRKLSLSSTTLWNNWRLSTNVNSSSSAVASTSNPSSPSATGCPPAAVCNPRLDSSAARIAIRRLTGLTMFPPSNLATAASNSSCQSPRAPRAQRFNLAFEQHEGHRADSNLVHVGVAVPHPRVNRTGIAIAYRVHKRLRSEQISGHAISLSRRCRSPLPRFPTGHLRAMSVHRR